MPTVLIRSLQEVNVQGGCHGRPSVLMSQYQKARYGFQLNLFWGSTLKLSSELNSGSYGNEPSGLT